MSGGVRPSCRRAPGQRFPPRCVPLLARWSMLRRSAFLRLIGCAIVLGACAQTTSGEPTSTADVTPASDAGATSDATVYCWISGPHAVPADAGGWWICTPPYQCGRRNRGGWGCCVGPSSECRE